MDEGGGGSKNLDNFHRCLDVMYVSSLRCYVLKEFDICVKKVMLIRAKEA